MGFKCLVALLCFSFAAYTAGFTSLRPVTVHPKTYNELWYDYFKKGPEKKEIGRIWKNIIFPGIFVEYEDTREVKKTVKVEVKPTKKVAKSRNEGDSFFSTQTKEGTYNVMDPKSVPQYISASQIKSKTLKPPTKPAGFVAPQPKKAISIQLGSGLSVLPNIASYPRPKKPLIIFDSETAPECKKVREACTVLDLTVEFRPCPGALYGWSDFMTTITQGRRTLPYMVDNNPSMYKPQLFGGKDIIEYLFTTYGPGADQVPKNLKVNGSSLGNGGGASGKGNRLRDNVRSDFVKLKPITLYGWEGAPYVKVVREALAELGLAHILINCSNGSQNREALSKRTKGVFQVPYIIDPNTGVEMFESAEIVKYLEQVYTVQQS